MFSKFAAREGLNIIDFFALIYMKSLDTKLRLLKLKVKTGEISLHLRIFSIKSQSPYLPLKKENFKKLCFLAMWYKVKSSLTVNTIRTRSIISNYPFLDTPMVGTPCSTDWVREAANCPEKSFCSPTILLIGKGLVPSNTLSSAKDLNFDTFFSDILPGKTVINIVTKGKLLLIFFLYHSKKNYRDIQMHWYDMYQFYLLNKVSMLGIAKWKHLH